MTTMLPNQTLITGLRSNEAADDRSQFAGTSGMDPERQARWREIVDMLLRWLDDPRSCIDEDYDPPTQAAIRAALRRASHGLKGSMVVPTRVAPIGDGGVVFEWQFEPTFIEVEIEGTGASELRSFLGGKLIELIPLGAPEP